MGTTLTGTTPQDTYDSLIKVTDNGPLSGSLKKLTDGLGNDSSLSLSTTAASFSGSLTISGDTVGSKFYTAGSALPTAGVAVFLNANYGGPAYNNSSFVTGNGATGVMMGGDTASYTYGWIQGVQTDNGNGKGLVLQPISGNVGIGTTTFGGKFQVKVATNANIAFNEVSGVSRISCFNDAISASQPLIISGETIRFTPAGTERARFTSDGLTFNGDTAAANALDDYEEGTFTPTITGSGSNPTYTGTSIGIYTKIGRQVTAQVDINLSTFSGGSGATRIELPFTVANSIGYFQAPCYVYGVDISGLYLTAEPNAGNSFMQINQIQDNAAAVALDLSSISAGDIIRITATYFV